MTSILLPAFDVSTVIDDGEFGWGPSCTLTFFLVKRENLFNSFICFKINSLLKSDFLYFRRRLKSNCLLSKFSFNFCKFSLSGSNTDCISINGLSLLSSIVPANSETISKIKNV